jgi:hypothetical protein
MKIEAPGAVARQQTDFGDATGCGKMDVAHLRMASGADLAPLLEGLPGDACGCPHWGYLIQGALTASYTDGSTEDLVAGDVFYLPPGHSVRVEEDAEMVLFSPQDEHAPVLDHIRGKLSG